MKKHLILLLAPILFASFHASAQPILIEAESFTTQANTTKRQWHVFSAQSAPEINPDGDAVHLKGASGDRYIELLPDTRRSHDDKLIKGENFTEAGGAMAMLTYKVNFPTAGRYYVWVRAFSTTTEDNGLHFGLNGKWPASGARWQTTQKNGWNWDCRQRTEEVHVGVPMQLWLDLEKPGEQEFHLSMREDGIEVDQLALTTDANWRPDGYKERAEPQNQSAKPKASTLSPSETKPAAEVPLVQPRKPDGDGTSSVSGELMQWHKVTITFDGPFAHERDTQPNPFTDMSLNVTFTHESGSPKYTVPGYFAADGNAAESGAESGTKWRVHISPDKVGRWTWEAQMHSGDKAALRIPGASGAKSIDSINGKRGEYTIAPSTRAGRDFRAHGRLQYVGKHHLQFSGSQEYFLKAGSDAPETLLGYADFDNTTAGLPDKVPMKTWQPHLHDWKSGDPTWGGGKGKGLIGALNYLADVGVNAFSFLTYNAGGDGDNVWPFVAREAKLQYDCSKLDQWGIVFDHATARGLYLHFKLQENEMDDNRKGHKSTAGSVPESLDGGILGPERRLYCREMIARFGHGLALNWNIGEESTQSREEIAEMAKYLAETDPYKHNIVVHTFPDQQEKVYTGLLGNGSVLTGASLQNSWNTVHQRTLQWRAESAKAGRPWVVANDEQNPADLGVPPDIGYRGGDGKAVSKPGKKQTPGTGHIETNAYTMHDIRKNSLWGNLMAGGAGVEYYFGYRLAENDLVCEDFRSRHQSWLYATIALDFFRNEKIPFAEMTPSDALIGNEKNDNSKYCLALPGQLYVIYLPNGGSTSLNLAGAEGQFSVSWFNPRKGGKGSEGSVSQLSGGSNGSIGAAPNEGQEDWVVLVKNVID